MPNHASATIIGHLGREPETRATQSGSKVFSTVLAVNTGYGDNKRTTWWNVSAFGKTAETLEKFNLSKGDAIGFTGEVSMREYIDKENNKRQSLELAVRDFILLGSKDDAKSETSYSKPKQISQDAPFSDEVPW